MTNFKIKSYEAPEGKVYDFAEPQFNTIKNLDGTETQEEYHLYAKYLNRGPRDSVDRYKLVKDPKKE